MFIMDELAERFFAKAGEAGPPSPVPSLAVSASTVGASSGGEEEVGEGYKFHGRYALLTWSRTRFTDVETFHRRLLEQVPEGTEVYGSMEDHKENGFHFHAVLRFPNKVHYTDARSHWLVRHDDGTVDTPSLNVRKPKARQNPEQFCEDATAYVEKDDNTRTFGKPFRYGVGANTARKRAYTEVHDESDPEEAWELLKQIDPRGAIYNYNNCMSFLRATKKRKRVDAPTSYEMRPYRLSVTSELEG